MLNKTKLNPFGFLIVTIQIIERNQIGSRDKSLQTLSRNKCSNSSEVFTEHNKSKSAGHLCVFLWGSSPLNWLTTKHLLSPLMCSLWLSLDNPLALYRTEMWRLWGKTAPFSLDSRLDVLKAAQVHQQSFQRSLASKWCLMCCYKFEAAADL